DDEEGAMGNLAMRSGVWQIFLSTAGMIAVINSVIVGTFVSLLLTALPAALPLGVSIGAGVAAFLVSVSSTSATSGGKGGATWARCVRAFPPALRSDAPSRQTVGEWFSAPLTAR